MVVILTVDITVSVAGIQCSPFIVRGQAAVSSREGVVEGGSAGQEPDGTHSSDTRYIGGLGGGRRGSKVLISHT